MKKLPPQKWLKYELLEQFGLADTEFLCRTIHRFPRSQSARFLSQLRQAVEAVNPREMEGGRYFFVVKFVPGRLSMLLPNIRIHSTADLRIAEEAIRGEAFGDYDEIWFCRTNISASSYSVAGRLLVNPVAGLDAQFIEQVWRCSPRLIEQLGPAFPYPFVRAARPGWRWAPRIEQIHLPPSAPETASTIREQFAIAMQKLDKIREKLEAFVDAVSASRSGICCLEYKIEDDRLQIIDWDTWDTMEDASVLRGLLPHESA